MGFRKPVPSPLAFRHLLVVLCEPQLSQSRRRKSSGGSAIGTSTDLDPVRAGYPMCSIWSGVGGTYRRLDHLSVADPFVKLQVEFGGQTVKLEFGER